MHPTNHQTVKTLNSHWKQICLFWEGRKPDLKWEIKQLLSAFTQLLLSEWGAIRNMTTPAKAIGIIRENLITKLHIYHYVIISSDPTCKLFYRYPSILSFQKVIKSKLYNILHFLRNTMHLYNNVTKRANSRNQSSH